MSKIEIRGSKSGGAEQASKYRTYYPALAHDKPGSCVHKRTGSVAPLMAGDGGVMCRFESCALRACAEVVD